MLSRFRVYGSLLLILVALLISTVPVSAHRDGCHRWHSCPSDSGSYVCGDLGYYSECPGGGSSIPAYTPPAVTAPQVPVVTTQTTTTDEVLPFTTQITRTNNEYTGYSQITQPGVNGLKRIYIEITLSDGAETGRKVVKTEVVTAPIAQLVSKGSRTQPVAKLTSFKTTKNKDKYDIAGKYRSKSEVVLSLDGKRIKRAKTDDKGNFVFKGIKVTTAKPVVAIYDRVNGKESKISEQTTVLNKAKSVIQTDYAKLHQVTKR